MKILIFANDDEGLFQFRKELLLELTKTNEVYASVPEGPYQKELEEIGVKLLTTNFNRRGINPFSDLSLLKKYVKLLKEIKPSIALTYTIKPNVYGGLACQKAKIPYIANITGLGTAVETGGLLSKISLMLYKKGLKKADMVFFQNEENQAFMLKKKAVKGQYDLLPGSGVNTKFFQPIDYPSGDVIHFSFISRIMKEKGIDQYLNAAKIIRAKYPNTCFHVCGYCEGDYQKTLEELTKSGVIVYHGRVRDVREIHKISWCTVHPTYYPEGLSNVLLESLACCRPIIATNRSGCKEIIDDEVNGFIVKQKDTDDLIKQLRRFIEMPLEGKKAMGINGRKKVEERFDRSVVVQKYLAAIEIIVGGAGR